MSTIAEPGNGWMNGLTSMLAAGIALQKGVDSKSVYWMGECMIVTASLCFVVRALVSLYWWVKRLKESRTQRHEWQWPAPVHARAADKEGNE